MTSQHLRKALCLLVMVALLIEIVATSGLNTLQVSAQPLTNTSTDQTAPSEQELLSMILNEYQASEDFIQQEQQDGLSLYEIYDVFKIADYQNLSYQEVKQAAFTKEVNLSVEHDTEITNSLLPDELRDIVTVESTDMTSEMLEALVQAEKENTAVEAERTEEIEETKEEQAVEQGKAKSSLRAMSTAIEFDMEEPKYNIKSFQQAPYVATSEQESISPLTGALSLSSTDVVMPGVNGLNFALTRVYDTTLAQQYEPGLRTQMNQSYAYYIYANYVKKPITYTYEAKYKQYYYLEYDYNKDGIKDYSSIAMNDPQTYLIGSYSSVSSAQASMNAFSLSASSKIATDYSTSSTNSFAATKSYSDSQGYTGTLSKSGTSYVSSGSYTPAQSKTATDSCVNTLPGKYNASGQWESTAPATNPCPDSKSYSSDGYTGTLSRTNTVTNKACESPGTPNWTCTKMYTANYSGTVTKPAVDTRVYRQDYSGTVTIQKQGEFKPGPWEAEGSYNIRQVYAIDSKWIDTVEKIAATGTNFVGEMVRLGEVEAKSVRDQLNNSAGAYAGTIEENGSKYALYVASTPNAFYQYQPVPNAYYYTYYNDTKMPYEEKLYPIGTGWSWDLPYMKFEDGKTYVHLQGGGTYEVSGTTLKHYEWLGLSLNNDTTVTVNNEKSAYRLSNIQGTWKQYFASDGRLLRIADAYNNYIDFKYTQHPTYNRKLISEISNNAGNAITISYSAAKVTIQYNNKSTVYNKRTEAGMELLASVVDVQGRTVSYNYDLKSASFNLVAQQPTRALNNPYALLKGIVHPTGALTEYQYEAAPVNRYIGENSTNQYYRVLSRHDKIVNENASSSLYNQYTYSYGKTDMGSSYTTDLTIATEVATSNMRSRYTHLKDYVNAEVGNKYYLTEQKNIADTTEKTITYQYNKKVGSNPYAVATPTTITSKDNLTNDPLTQTFVYNDYGNMTQAVDMKGLVSNYTYFPTTQLLATSTVPADTATKLYTAYTYNSQGTITRELVKTNNSSGALVKQIDYQNIAANGNIGKVVETDADGALTYTLTYSNNLLSKVSTVVPNGDNTSTTVSRMYTYDPATGALLNYKDGYGKQTSYQYDALGRIVRISYPDATAVSAVYNDLENKVTVTDALNNQSITTWNGLGWEKEQGIVDGQGYRKQLSYSYTNYGQVEWIRDAVNALTTYKYDKWGRIIETLAPNGVAQIVEYNDANRQVTTKQRSALNTVKEGVTQVHDRYGRLTQIIEHNYEQKTSKTIQSNTYHPVTDNIITTVDGEQNQTKYVYDALGNMIKVIDALGKEVAYQYNGSNQLTKTIYANGTSTTKTYDALGRMVASTDQQGRKRTFAYDLNHNLISQTDNKGQVFKYQYDVMNRLLNKQGPTEKISFTYNGNGQRLTMQDRTGVTKYTYKPYTGQLASVTTPDGKAITYTYNAAQQLTSSVLPFGDVVDYSYDTIGRANQVSWNKKIAERYTYNAFGDLAERSQGNGMVTSYERTNGILSKLSQSIDEQLVNLYRYEHDQNKNITAIVKQVRGQSSNEAYTYDELNRVTSATPFNETYSYDEQHNRRTLTSSKPIEHADTQYEYDEWDRLVRVKRDGKEIQYSYNGDNLLVERIEAGAITRYYYDGDHIVAEGIVSGGTVREKASYLVHDQLVLREDQQGAQSYYGFNGHGDVTELRDANGNLQNHYEYDMWGSVMQAEETVEQPFLYAGEYWDQGAQLQYLRARWYDPSVGRFINKDTYEGDITNPLSLNLYTYVANNPLKYIDPTGHRMEIDRSIDPLYNRGERDSLKQYETDYWSAYRKGDKYGMQAAHDGANLIRLRYADSVKRVDFINGGSSMVSKTNNTIMSKEEDGVIVQTYVKGEISLSLMGNVGAVAKVQANTLVITLSYGANGKIGGSASLTGGVSISNGGKISNSAYIGDSRQFPYFIVAEGKFSYDFGDADWEGILGGGVGITAEIPMYSGEYGMTGDYVTITINSRSKAVNPMTYNEWMDHLGR